VSVAKRELHDAEGNSRGWYSEANRVNDLTGREWVFWSRSVITKPYPPNLQHALRNRHGGQKPPELCADLVRAFSKQGQSVLDPFMGVGGVLLGASLAGREATGIEINPEWIRIYREVCRLEGIDGRETIAGDARSVLPSLAGRVFDLVLTDVPYWKMDRVPRSRGTWKRVGEPSRPVRGSRLADFGAGVYADKAAWLSAMGEIFARAAALLKVGGYLVTFIGDMYRDNEYHCLSAELAGELARIPGLVWKANLVWYDVSKRLHLYGYQYAYIPSLIHQNVLVFRREA
jgi:DNA modification methylase